MAISMYRASVPPIVRSLTNLRAILEKAAAHAEAKKIDPSVLLTMRQYPDMFPLSRQIQIVTDNAKRGSLAPLRLAAPNVPVTELRVESEVLEVRPSKSGPEQGLIKVRTTTLNQNGETVQISIGNLLVPRRPA